MFNYRVMNADKVRAFVTGLMSKCIPVSFADDGSNGGNGGSPTEPTPSNTPSNQNSQINFEDLMARARKEEKDKLYPQIQKLKDDLKAMTDYNNANLLKIGELQDKLAAYESGGESEEVKTLKQKIADLEKENKQLKESQPNVEEIKAQCKAEYEVELYKVQQLGTDDVKNTILPMFLNDITGKTKEEIDASIQSAKEKTEQVKEQLGVGGENGGTNPDGGANPEPTNNSNNGSGNNGGLFGNAGFRSVNPPTPNPIDPTHGQFEGENGWDYVKKLDLNTPEGRQKYSEWRQKVGLR